MIEVFTARSGAPSVRVDGRAMHSSYDPAREADRFLDESLGAEIPSTVVILGECMGYLTDAVRRRFPRTRVLPVTYSAELAHAAQGLPGDTRPSRGWHPGMGTSLADHLRLHMDEWEIEGLRVVEWPPSARAFTAESRAANEAVHQVVQELNGSFVTTVGAGRLWLRNSLVNFICLDPPLSGALCASPRPIVIAAPGPSLEDAAPLLLQARAQIDLWALPSSCPFLRSRGLTPDLVVMTDPGFYSVHHLHFVPVPCPVAMPLSAARGTWSLHSARDQPEAPATYLLEQPFLFEGAFLKEAGIHAPKIAPHGTVAATAVDLALSSTKGPVIVAGLDMSARDLLSHARPNAFDTLLHLQSSRVEPHSSLLFARSALQRSEKHPAGAGLRATPALRTYAGWFDQTQPGPASRVYRLLPTAVALRSMLSLDPAGWKRLLGAAGMPSAGTRLQPVHDYPSRAARGQIAVRIIDGWIGELAGARESLADPSISFDSVRFPSALSLAHIIAPRRLVEARKKARLDQLGDARRAAGEMLDECTRFLRQLEEKTLGSR